MQGIRCLGKSLARSSASNYGCQPGQDKVPKGRSKSPPGLCRLLRGCFTLPWPSTCTGLASHPSLLPSSHPRFPQPCADFKLCFIPLIPSPNLLQNLKKTTGRKGLTTGACSLLLPCSGSRNQAGQLEAVPPAPASGSAAMAGPWAPPLYL